MFHDIDRPKRQYSTFSIDYIHWLFLKCSLKGSTVLNDIAYRSINNRFLFNYDFYSNFIII